MITRLKVAGKSCNYIKLAGETHAAMSRCLEVFSPEYNIRNLNLDQLRNDGINSIR